jgi:predicted phage terminase large subunit-like protein
MGRSSAFAHHPSPQPAETERDRTTITRQGCCGKRCKRSDCNRERRAPGAIERLVVATAAHDGRGTAIALEQEPGAAGVALVDSYKRRHLRSFTVRSERASGGKDVRAQPVAAAAENGLIRVVRGRHVDEFLDELTAFPHGAHDDCVDALAGAHGQLTRRGSGRLTAYVPRARIPVDSARTHDYPDRPTWS